MLNGRESPHFGAMPTHKHPRFIISAGRGLPLPEKGLVAFKLIYNSSGLISAFQDFSSIINKTLILARRLATGVSFYGGFRQFPNIS